MCVPQTVVTETKWIMSALEILNVEQVTLLKLLLYNTGKREVDDVCDH